MKKILFAAFILLTSTFTFGQVQLSVGDVKAVPGSKVLVPIAISEGKDISGIQFVLNFEADVVSVPDDKAAVRGEALADHNIGASRQGNQFNVVVFSSSLSRLKPGSGILLNVLIQIPSSAPNGRASAIHLSDVQASDASGNSVTVTTKDGTVFIGTDTNTPAAGANELLFPQIANGSFPGGSFVTTLIFVNRTGALTTGEARFFKSDGTPFSVKLTDGRSGSSFTFTVAEGGSAFLQTDGSGALSAGYARISATGPLGGTILFSQLDGAGKTIAEAGVGASAPGTRFSIPVLYQKGAADTGIAFANVSSQTAELALTLRDKTGAIVNSQKASLLPGQHLPRFATEFFTSLASQSDFSGSIEASAPVAVSAVALKVQGKLITTFPVIQAQYVPPSVSNLVPAVSSISPASAAAGGAPFTLAVNGTNFVSGSIVQWNGSNRATTFVSGTQLNASISAADIAAAGTATVTVLNPPPGGGLSNALSFTISSASTGTAPTINDVKVTVISTDSAKLDIQLTDPDGDIVRLDVSWYQVGAKKSSQTLNSPADVNLAGLKSGTISYTFTGIGVPSPFGTVSPDRVDVQATDAKGLKSNIFSKSF
ncbi:MAG TPA: cohesin domain-containing protein [Acidobacteriota bacterium]|nr:cohesin domain-containing protein [Acidobacteriota bacterium]